MNKNTSELWSVVPGYYPGFVEILGASFKIIVVTHAADIDLAESLNRLEDAHRIVACVNACDGMEDPAAFIAGIRKDLSLATHKLLTCGVAARHPDASLSRRETDYGGKWNSPQAESVRQLRQERDELLAALDEISKLPSYRQDECSEMARDAIAKANGGAS